MRLTINKIAELAKVSRGTVDRVLNNRPGVSEKTKKKVNEIIKALDYKPNSVAKSLVALKKPIKIGVIMAPDYNPFVDEIKRGVKEAAEDFYDYGVSVEARVMNSLDPDEQCSILKKLYKEKCSGIAMVAIESEAVSQQIDEIVSNGVPIVTFNSDIKNKKRLCFVGQDHVIGGRAAGGLIGKVLKGEGEVAVITSSFNLLCHAQRVEGFRSKLSEDYPKIKIVGIYENEDLSVKSFQHVIDIHNKFPNISGIYITGGGTKGAGSALESLNLSNKVAVVCHDFVPDTIELIKKRVFDFTIGQNPYFQGYQPVKILFDYLVNRKMPESEFISISLDIRMEENIGT